MPCKVAHAMYAKRCHIVMLVALALAGCDGSGSSTGAPTLAPLPELASIDESAANRLITLTATATDPDGGQLTYRWSVASVVGGGGHQTRTLTDSGAFAMRGIVIGASGEPASTTFSLAAEHALNLTSKFTITFSVLAQDSAGTTSSSRTVTLTVTANDDAPVIAAVNSSKTDLKVGNAATLSASIIDENVAILSYDWTIVSGAALGTLTNDATTATFTAHADLSRFGNVVIGLSVNDGNTISAHIATSVRVVTGCASYGLGATAKVGTRSGSHCNYDEDFVDYDNPLTENITLVSLPNDGTHIFAGALVVGTSATTAELSGSVPAITEGGDGPSLIIEPGATVAFMNAEDLLIINRGSQIVALGRMTSPVTFTSDEDVTGGVAAAGQWGGIIINGFGVRNTCAYTASGTQTALRTFAASDPYQIAADTPALTASEACDESTINLALSGEARSFHGGTSNADNSGILRYAIIKYAGGVRHQGSDFATPALALAAVGSATEINNVQVFAANNYGISIVGGNAAATNLLIYNARGAGLSISGGYVGRLNRVLISQANASGGSCIVAQGDANGALDEDTNMLTRAAINQLTCDISPTTAISPTTGEAPLVGGTSGSGLLVGNGANLLVENAIVVASGSAASLPTNDDNYCMRIGPDGAGQNARLTLRAAVLSCFEAGDDLNAGGVTAVRAHLVAAGDPTSDDFTALNILSAAGTEDARPIFSLLQSASTITAIGGSAPIPTAMYTPEGLDENRLPITFLGAIAVGNNPFASWAFGVFQQLP